MKVQNNTKHTYIVDVRPVTDEDRRMLDLFREHAKEFRLDVGSLDERELAAAEMTRRYFKKPYEVWVDTYCVGCTVTCLKKTVYSEED